MSVIERDLTHFALPDDYSNLERGSDITSFTLVSGPETRYPGFEWKLDFPLPQAYRVRLAGPGRPRPPHDNVKAPLQGSAFTVLSIDESARKATFGFPGRRLHPGPLAGLGDARLELRLSWSNHIVSEAWHVHPDGSEERVLGDLGSRSYGLTEHGIIRHWRLDRTRLHLGLGEKAAPIDLTGRKFTLHATDAALYDSYRTDPLYKHTPFLISTPRPTEDHRQGLTYAIFHGTNSVATWDVGAEIDYPSGGWSKRFIQDWGGLEEWVLVGRGVEGVVKTYAEMAGKPKLVGRDWLGYLASTVLLSAKENAQELLEEWPQLCLQHDIPCSAMHLSSGFTVDENSGNHWVFHINKDRYPDFAGMVKVFHRAGMRFIPNFKPYLLLTHPAYEPLKRCDGLFYDPISKGPSTQHLGEGTGSWADFSAPETRRWWSRGVERFVELGVDGIWEASDNSEFFTRDDALICRNEFDYDREVTVDGKVNTGLLGRIAGNEAMNKVSYDAMQDAAPDLRPFVLTRSGNPAAFKYACSTWSGDNLTSWHNLRGSQHIQLNSAVSLMQNTGADVGGFGGAIPTHELFARWVQLGVMHSRFCIHSAASDDKGNEKLSTPWMHPEVLPIVRDHIKWRYAILPFLNDLMWRSHLHAAPPNAPLFYGPFATDPVLYSDRILEGFDAWLGVGQLLSAPQLFEGSWTREVYLPRSSPDDQSLYFDLHSPFTVDRAGNWLTVATPIEHGGLFAREGAVIPVGKEKATVTALSGPPVQGRSGARVVLDGDGGQVGADDWRGVLIFPGREEGNSYAGEWIEDDGISQRPGTCTVRVSYAVRRDGVRVRADVEEAGFKPLWGGRLYFILPVGDLREVLNCELVERKGRRAWAFRV